ncbi:hypothetical protein LV78_007788 [Actinosynnema pretiosum]|nr:hypothetical protein [Actinosynnema pretiosum]
MPPSDHHESDPGERAPRTTPSTTTPIRTPPVGNTQCAAGLARTATAAFGTMPFNAATSPRAAAPTHLIPPGSRRRVRRKTGERP